MVLDMPEVIFNFDDGEPALGQRVYAGPSDRPGYVYPVQTFHRMPVGTIVLVEHGSGWVHVQVDRLPVFMGEQMYRRLGPIQAATGPELDRLGQWLFGLSRYDRDPIDDGAFILDDENFRSTLVRTAGLDMRVMAPPPPREFRADITFSTGAVGAIETYLAGRPAYFDPRITPADVAVRTTVGDTRPHPPVSENFKPVSAWELVRNSQIGDKDV